MLQESLGQVSHQSIAFWFSPYTSKKGGGGYILENKAEIISCNHWLLLSSKSSEDIYAFLPDYVLYIFLQT